MHDSRNRTCRCTLLLLMSAATVNLVACGPPDEKAQANPAPAPTPVASAPATPAVQTPATLAERVEHYWQATVKDDWTTLYEYRDPRDRDKATLEQFTAWSTENEPFSTHAYEVHEILEEPGAASARLTLTTSMRKFTGTPTRETERWHVWRTVQDNWYPVPLLELESYPETPALRNAEEEARLSERFDTSWKLRQEEQWDQLYQMSDPRDHGEVPFDQFVTAFDRSSYLDAEVFWTEVIDDGGRVRLRFRHKLKDPSLTKLPPKVVLAFEEWVLVDGDWYLDLVKQK